MGSKPEIYANGAPVGDIPVGSKFYRDFRPGTYRFTVQSYGLPTGAADTVYLAPGTQTYLEIEWLASWQEGYPEAGYSFPTNTFGIRKYRLGWDSHISPHWLITRIIARPR